MQGVVTGCEITKYTPPTKAKNHFNGCFLYCGECQRIMTFCQRNEYSFLSPVKQRIRDFFAEPPESKEVFREFPFFYKSLCGKHFYGTKKSQSSDWLKYHWQRLCDKTKDPTTFSIFFALWPGKNPLCRPSKNIHLKSVNKILNPGYSIERRYVLIYR